MRIEIPERILAATLCTVLAGCAGNGEGLDANGRPIGEGGGGGGVLTADFASIQQHVFTPICTVCHAGAGAPQGLRLDAANSYDLLVGVPSNEVPGLQRVKPGDPEASYLIQKLEGHASVGARMPLGGPYLEQATIDVIRQWITDGAQRSASAAAKPGFDIAVRSPAPGDAIAAGPVRIVVAFTHDLDLTRLDAGALALMRTDATAPAIPVTLATVNGNPRALIVTSRAPLPPGRYALRASDDTVSDLSSLSLAHPTDGDVELTTFITGDTP